MFRHFDDIPILAYIFGKPMHRTVISKCGKKLKTYKAKQWRGILYIYKEVIHNKECDENETSISNE
jgi:hypothetical protein